MRMTVIYWSATGNTEAMAQAIAQGAKEAGADVSLVSVSDITPAQAAGYDLLALGCPAMGTEELEEGEFAPFFEAIEGSLAGKKLALFGSYGWGDGQWMRDWQDRTEQAGARLFRGEGLIVNETPDDDALADCKAFGRELASL